MTGNEMMKKALTLLGYTDSTGETSGEQRFRSRALTVLNGVYSDLFYIKHRDGFVPLSKTTDNIELSERELNDIMPYGVAAFLAQSESDGDQQQIFISLYNSKRAALTKSESVGDVIPCPE